MVIMVIVVMNGYISYITNIYDGYEWWLNIDGSYGWLMMVIKIKNDTTLYPLHG